MDVFLADEGQLESLAGRGGEGRILLVTGAMFFETCGAADRLGPILENNGYLRFSDYSRNPTVESFGRLHQAVRADGLDGFSAILAVGGGTSIDLAKLLKAFARNEEFNPMTLREPLVELWDIPLLAVPTTAGSGSEATHFAVIYDGHEKLSIADQHLRPDAAFLEPELLRSLPQAEAASGGLDALCQGIESFWSDHATERSLSLAADAARLAWETLESFVLERTGASMDAMGYAALTAGKAIDLTKTTAPHAISYPLTSRYGVGHGHAVALMLAAILPFNAQSASAEVRRKIDAVCRMLGVENGGALEAAEVLRAKIRRLGLSTELPDLGISTEDDLEFILNHGFNPGRVANGPRALAREELHDILHPLILK
ncbi:MAG: alcohol dehydrogenase class IV [Verrucomicrobiales bacterium]|jgi:alcohol dehydrogenase class IV